MEDQGVIHSWKSSWKAISVDSGRKDSKVLIRKIAAAQK